MEDINPTALSQWLASHRTELVDKWYRTLMEVNATTCSAQDTCAQLDQIANQCSTLLLATTLDVRSAEAIGALLAKQYSCLPDVLSQTQRVLWEEWTSQLPAPLHAVLLPRLIELTSAITAGFTQAIGQSMLKEREQVREALGAELLRLMDELRASDASLHATLENERRQIARDLHDGVVQQLLGMSYRLSQTRHWNEGGAYHGTEKQSRWEELHATLHRELIDVVDQIRQITCQLRRFDYGDVGLSSMLENFIASLDHEFGLDLPIINYDVDPADNLPPKILQVIRRAMQELVRNTLRHAKANHLSIFLRVYDTYVMLRVIDDGVGFTVPKHVSQFLQAQHFGLVGLLEQVEALNGILTTVSELDMGTEITVALPLEPAQRAGMPHATIVMKEESDAANPSPACR